MSKKFSGIKNEGRKGDVVILSVKEHNGTLAFAPKFIDADSALQGNGKSMRVFVTKSVVAICEGEDWLAVIDEVKPAQRFTNDNRQYIFVTVTVQEQYIHLRKRVDMATKTFVIEKWCGRNKLDETMQPLAQLRNQSYKHNGSIVRANVYKVDDTVVGKDIVEISTEKDYINRFASNLGIALHPRSLASLLNKIPELPEVSKRYSGSQRSN